MALSVQELLTNKGIRPPQDKIAQLESKWAEIVQRRGDLENVAVDDADISVRNIPGGDHVR
ncbi:hypothetical protein O4162_15595 [Dietzia maris]|uniref:hypothetical protein n=1 Tax=Dietzia maris TaxID=37915 RepID=UPI0022B59033|nr:hypothetical protein [Dietzia maris]MCZ4541565.1 hypothetical protein [Dietzia maris]